MKKNKIFDLPIATNLGSALTETMKSVSQHEGGLKQGEINLPNFKEEVCTCTDECLGYLTKSCKRIEEPKQEYLEGKLDKIVSKEPSKFWEESDERFKNKETLEKYSERFDNKENEVVDGIFDSENWGRRIVKQETLTNDTNSHSWGFENFEVIKTEEDAKIFIETMENIPEPNDKLKKAFRDFNKQETLEEAKVNNLIKLFGKDYDLEPRCVIESCNDSLIYGVEWQAEQNKNLYNKEDLWESYKASNTIFEDEIVLRQEFEKWFEKKLKRNNI